MCGPLVEFCGDCRAIALDAGCFRAAIVTGASKGIGAALAKGSDAGACPDLQLALLIGRGLVESTRSVLVNALTSRIFSLSHRRVAIVSAV
jgi:hypothetical protein